MSVFDFAPYESGVKYTQRRREKIQSYCEMTIKKISRLNSIYSSIFAHVFNLLTNGPAVCSLVALIDLYEYII